MGKSTLLNALLGEKLSIITHKPQTTRHRIIAIANTDEYQIVFSDTPGIILDPGYKMQQAMNSFAFSALEDADVLIFMIDVLQPTYPNEELSRKLSKCQCPKYVILNKIDIADAQILKEVTKECALHLDGFQPVAISALEQMGTQELLKLIEKNLPEGPAYYPKDQFTDRSERFFVSEIIREKIFINYKQEIPYSSEVVVTSFKEDEKIINIEAEIFVERDSQKGIIIGKKAESIKKVGMQARKDMEAFFGKKIHLQTFVKVEKDWRKDDRKLSRFGY